MGYDLQAFIAKREVLEKHRCDYKNAKIILLPQELAMIPLQEALVDEVNGNSFYESSCEEEILEDDSEEDLLEDGAIKSYEILEDHFYSWIKKISLSGKVAMLSIDCFGGECMSQALLLENGKMIYGPLKSLSGYMNSPSLRDTPSNVVLRLLGVQSKVIDEFETLRLGQKRSTEDW